MKTVVCLGTSLTHQYHWIPVVQQRLARASGEIVEVLNYGGEGLNSVWGLSQIAAIVRLKPWAVVGPEFCMNDCGSSVSLIDAANNHIAMVNQIHASGVPLNRIYTMTMNRPIGSVGSNPPYNALASYHAQYRTLAASLGTGLIDNEPQWLSEPESSWVQYGLENSIHPNDESERRITGVNVAAALIAAL
jgi:lysophospholipase L1-like esterase